MRLRYTYRVINYTYNTLFMKFAGKNIDLGLLFLRILVGGVFINHGLMKLANMKGTIGFLIRLVLGHFLHIRLRLWKQ